MYLSCRLVAPLAVCLDVMEGDKHEQACECQHGWVHQCHDFFFWVLDRPCQEALSR